MSAYSVPIEENWPLDAPEEALPEDWEDDARAAILNLDLPRLLA